MSKVFVEASDVSKGRFIDARYDLQNKEWGKQAFRETHIENAVYWDLEENLSDMTKNEGRHPMPSKNQLQTLFEAAGLTYEDKIYIYDQGGAPFAARAWWMLKFAGFPHVFIVNGGLEALKAAGFPMSNEQAEFQQSSLDLNWNESIRAQRKDVKKVVDGIEKAILLDARAAARYRGEHEPLDKVAGHIPIAKNFDWEQLRKGAELRGNDNLRQAFRKDEDIVVYCGSGVTASPLYAILAHEGYENIRLYVGSYSDWITQYEVEAGSNE